jgi:hypothetical protein
MQVFGAIGIDRLNSTSTTVRRMRTALPILLTLNCAVFALAEGAAEKQPTPQSTVRLIGATTVVTEVSTGLPLAARVDTGATSCSIHCEAFEIKDADPDPKVNIGKPVRFLVKHKKGEGEWVESKIADYVTIRTSESENERYKVRLKLRWEDMEKKVLVTLNDRENMKYPLLLGRNFLRDDFVVNVSLDADE